MKTQTLLQLLRSRSVVDCDTMDASVPKTLGPFVDCTSNQAIAVFELLKERHQGLITESRTFAKEMRSGFASAMNMGVGKESFSVEVAMVKLMLEISKHVTGYVHVQVNPYYAYNVEQMVQNGRRIVEIFQALDPDFDRKRVCIKIPSTWEGFQACAQLEKEAIATLATTLFTIEQAYMAAQSGCHYIAPYVNELKVHFEAGSIDHNKAQSLCVDAQELYEANSGVIKTQVLPASLTSIEEIMTLTGAHHITIAPSLLQELYDKPASALSIESLFDSPSKQESELSVGAKQALFYGSEAEYRMALTRSNGGNGEAERKLVQAINIFCDMQDKLEQIMR